MFRSDADAAIPRIADYCDPHTCVDVEQVVARHARLARHARRNDHQVHAVERGWQLVVADETAHLGRRARFVFDIVVSFQPSLTVHAPRSLKVHTGGPEAAVRLGKNWRFVP